MDDVNVLRQACCAFRNLFLKLVKIDPFRQAITISSICNKVFRTMFLKPDSVDIIPRGGYRMRDRQSVEVLQRLAYIGRTRNDATHAGNGREVHLPGVPNVKDDGYCAETKEVFVYLGCFWHGCPCMPNRLKPIGNTDETLLGKYEETMARLQKIRDAGYNVPIWGCRFRKLLRENPGLENELSSHPYLKNSPINIRDALYGGRTEASEHGTELHRGKKSVMWM
jgi:G:T-mismatch repair DNA endonuclease (very short patch repair protein)